MPVPGAAVLGIGARRLERGIREQRLCPGGDLLLEGRGSAVPSLQCVCMPVQGAHFKSVGVSPDEAVIQTENWDGQLASSLGAPGICNMRKWQGRSPRAVGLGSRVGKTRSHPVNPQPPRGPSSLTYKYRKDPSVLCESSGRNSILFQEVFWGAIMDSAGILRNVPSRRQL